MVITNLIGGLGNQMFQVAAGMSLANQLQTELLLDIAQFQNYDLRDYELPEVFSIPFPIANNDLTKKFLWHEQRFINRLPGKFHRLIHKQQNITHLKEQSSYVDNRFFNVKGDVYLWGFWNSEQYFTDIEPMIRKLFQFKKTKTKSVIELSNTISHSNSVSLHVRRGDYAYVSKTNKVHGLCSLDYYQHATTLITKLIPSPHFFVFSDDIQWCKKNLTGENLFFVEHSGVNADDMRLMALCKHHIIANSTFSWWGAWLNPDPNKIVIAPRPWNQTPDRNDRDICPIKWITLGI